jgi:hypothetical protein
MADEVMRFKVGGLWLERTSNGKLYYKGNFNLKTRNPQYPEIPTIVESLKKLLEAGTDRAVIKVWVNEDKRTEKSPDMSIVIETPWKGEPRDAPPKEEAKATVDDDIPF